MNKIKLFYVKLKATVSALGKAFKARAPLASFITGRILTMLVLLFLLGFALFGLMELAPGDIVDQMMTQQLLTNTENPSAKTTASNAGGSQDKNFSAEQMEALRSELGLDKPFYVQYFKWLKRVIVNHDLGTSLISKAPVGFLI
jgi:peptide/nickel transport system permease protein